MSSQVSSEVVDSDDQETIDIRQFELGNLATVGVEMLPPLCEGVLSVNSEKESYVFFDHATSDLGFDRLRPYWDVTHNVKITMTCLSGMNISSTALDQVRIILAVYRQGEFIGSSAFSKPLSLSSSRMAVDSSTNQLVAIWPGTEESPVASMEFEVPLKMLSNMVFEPDKLELIVFVADGHHKKTVDAVPIGRGSFAVVDHPRNPNNSVIDLRIGPIDFRDGYTAVKMETITVAGVPTTSVIKTCSVPSKQAIALASQYHFDKYENGYARMEVEWARKVLQRERQQTPPRENDDCRSTRSQNEVRSEESFLQERAEMHGISARSERLRDSDQTNPKKSHSTHALSVVSFDDHSLMNRLGDGRPAELPLAPNPSSFLSVEKTAPEDTQSIHALLDGVLCGIDSLFVCGNYV